MKYIDRFLNGITMYRLLLYYLAGLLAMAVIFSFFGKFSFSPVELIFSAFFLLLASEWINKIFAWFFSVQPNVESSYITGLILALIVTPLHVTLDFAFYLLALSLLAMASKYVLTIYKKNIFNPAAFAAVVSAFVLNHSASWWVGAPIMLPFVLIGGFLLVKKIQRFGMVFAFLIGALLLEVFLSVGYASPIHTLYVGIAVTPIIFFAAVMLTEPLTSPGVFRKQIIYGLLVSLFFVPQSHVGSFYFTPELALLAGNILTLLIAGQKVYQMSFKETRQIAADAYSFNFISDQKLNFKPGQYLEWTVSPSNSDLRGNRRYFTIASSPTESEVSLGVKFYESPSTFKQKFLALRPGEKIAASRLAGDFVLPHHQNEKLAFIAGGIGITPFRSMIKYLIDKNEPRDIILLYSSKRKEDFAYVDVLEKARQQLGVKIGYTLMAINMEIISSEIPDFKERTFYISGPQPMVKSIKSALMNLGLSRRKIKTDFFPGLV